MVLNVSRVAILLCMLVSVASIGSLWSDQVTSERESQRHLERESQHESLGTDLDLRVPIRLESFLQEGDINTRHAAEELRLPDTLLMFLQQSEPLTPQGERLTLGPRQPSQ